MTLIKKLSEINEGETVDFDYQGQPAILIKFNGKLFAYVNVCTHEGGPCILEEAPGITKPGEKRLHCQWHDSTFNPTTGEAMTDPAPEGSRLEKIEIKIEGDTVYVV